ncbi:hypothetical protein FGO68_gene7170 [Halteria grandinella]|uniref:Protein-tyrosine-phosphatase n=1 Tax=Halteria grandinella TaxID=5974 RepID=A0A8J8NI92_HALGN|nr:hypothetical protein FGO68_gene7170 [Halteria grandinella]
MESDYSAPSDGANIDQIIDGLYLGSMTSAFNKDLLEVLGIKAIVTVADQIEPLFPESIDYHIIRVLDLPSEDLLSHFPKAYDFIHKYISKDQNVLVHCANGISRSPTVLASYLMKNGKLTAKDALSQVQSCRRVNPNRGFLEQLEKYEKELI